MERKEVALKLLVGCPGRMVGQCKHGIGLTFQRRHPSTPVLAHSTLPNAIMPAHRHPSIARSHAPRRPHKASIIIISSDEEEESAQVGPVPKRGSRRPKRPRAAGEILEILEDTSVKVEEPELEDLRQRCHELEQACSPYCSLNLPNKRDSPCPTFLGVRHVTE